MKNKLSDDDVLRGITVCQPQIAKSLSNLAKDGWKEKIVIHQVDSLKSCLDALSKENYNFLILQLSSPVKAMQDFLSTLGKLEINIGILLFQITDKSYIHFTTTTCEGCRLALKASDFFTDALRDQYNCLFMTYKDPEWEKRFHHDETTLVKREVIFELLRGVNYEEFQSFKEKFDLKNNGYYLFVWELNESELSNYMFKRNIYRFIREVQNEEYQAVLKSGRGGEVFNLDISTVLILFNDFTSTSVSRRISEMQRMKKNLAYIGSSKEAFQFLSAYIPGIEHVKKAYESYQKSRPYRFFCRENDVLTFEIIKSSQRWIPEDYINESLSEIRNIIQYNLKSEKLLELVRRIFLEIIKPSMSYTLYYSLSDAVHSMLKNEIAINDLRDALNDPYMLYSIQYSSIEEKCDEMVQYVRSLQQQIVNSSNTYNNIILKTIEFIKDNYSSNIKVPELAKEMNISTACLNQYFKKEVGIGVKSYLIEKRLEKAKDLLMTTDDPVYTVAYNVGFNDYRHFSKTFKKKTGFSPSKYRNQ